jgi:alpha-beta hydrolase superfamily lysophospholipase
LSGGASDMTPVTFDGLLGWLHMPRGRNNGVGVVLVSALGRDGRCAYAPMRMFADQLAAAGFPTIRYDHLGSGDSLDLPDDEADALPDWITGMGQAAEALRTRAGASQVVMCGARIGAALAMINPAPVDGLVLLAPVLAGRSWLRRLRFSASVTKKPEAGGSDEQPLDTEGLWLSSATVGSLSRLDLAKLPPPKVPLFIASQNKPVSDYAAALAEAGAAIHTTDFPGFGDLYLETTVNEPPLHVFERALAWLQQTFEPVAAPNAAAPALQPDAPIQRPPGAVERVVRFGENLRGVLCEPEGPASRLPAVLFCNTGGDPRAGAGGFAAGAARRLAVRGVASLRFDFAGIGDSPMRAGEPRPHVFETPREADADAAVDFLAEGRSDGVVVVGICSGAYHALRTGWRNPKVTGVFAVSPIKLLWRPGDDVSFARDEYLYAFKDYAKAVFRPEAWKLLLQIGPFGLLRALGNRLIGKVQGWLSRSGGDSPFAKTKRFAQRGGRALFYMGVNDTAVEEVATYFGARGAKFERLPGLAVDIVPELDHGLVRRASRQMAVDRLTTWLSAAK